MSITMNDDSKNPKDEKKSKETIKEAKTVPAAGVSSAEAKAPITEEPKPATSEVVEDKPAEVGTKETVVVESKPAEVKPSPTKEVENKKAAQAAQADTDAKKAFTEAKKSMYVKQFDGVGPGASLAAQFAFVEEYAREMVASGAWVVDTTAYEGKTVQFLYKAKK